MKEEEWSGKMIKFGEINYTAFWQVESLQELMLHWQEEMGEATMAIREALRGGNVEEAVKELTDVQIMSETLKKKLMPSDVKRGVLLAKVIEKNLQRGYYEPGKCEKVTLQKRMCYGLLETELRKRAEDGEVLEGESLRPVQGGK